MTRRSTLRCVLGGTVAAALAASSFIASPAQASPPHPYTISVGSTGAFDYPTDTPAFPFLDSDGTFHFQQSAALYGASDPREWDFFTGHTMDDATPTTSLDTAVNPTNPADRNDDTTWRCDNGPTGRSSTKTPTGSGYAQPNYCDLVGTWVDPDSGNWYGLVHNEFTPQPFGDGLHYDAIDYAVSKDHGYTWTILDHVITSPYSTTRGDTAAFPQQTYYYGDGDPRLYVDTASGYFYVYYGSRVVDKNGGWKAFYEHVARAPISGRMAPSTWRKYYAGSWSQPGQGGKESNLVPVDATNQRGYTPPAQEYKPTTAGTSAEQIAAGTMPATSPLFVMDITYDAYLGVYLGEPQQVDQTGNAPGQLYWTTNLATQKWRLLGDLGGYTDASWYRWFLDGANGTSNGIVGKTFRRYCSIACHSSDGEYADVTVTGTPATSPVQSGQLYRIGTAQKRVLLQVQGHATTVSWPSSTSSALANWKFVTNGDGSYRIVNAATGALLGVDSTTTQGRAWGATLTARRGSKPTVGQQWFIVADTNPANGSATGSYHLTNRYSGLELSLPTSIGGHASTQPLNSATGNAARAAQQTLAITAVGREQ